MDEDEVFIFILSLGGAVVGCLATSTFRLHPLYLRANPAVGIVRLAVWAAVAWIGFVIWRFADPSVTGIYVVFYLVMGFALVKIFGQLTGGVFGPRFRVDVCERKNTAAALLLGAFTLCTGLIFGGSLWGEADPNGEGEGGWWIPLTFFLLGWGTMAGTLALFLWREPEGISLRLRRERSLDDARAVAGYLVGTAWIVTETVAGDFYGWWHGLLTLAVVIAMLLTHELARERAMPTSGEHRAPARSRRLLESAFYLFCGISVWTVNRFLDRHLGPGL